MARPRLFLSSLQPASTGPVNHHLQKQSHLGPQHKSSQLNRVDTIDELPLHGNIAQEATLQVEGLKKE